MFAQMEFVLCICSNIVGKAQTMQCASILKLSVLFALLAAGIAFDVAAGMYLWRHFGERGNTRIPLKTSATAIDANSSSFSSL
jgi:hypothetical protein